MARQSWYVLFLCACGTVAAAAPARVAGRPATQPVKTAAPAPPARTLGECLAARGATLYLDCYVPAAVRQVIVLGEDVRKVRTVVCLSCMETYVANPECVDRKIVDYPTWIFADGTRFTGLQSRDALALKAGCGASAPPPPAPTR